MDLSRMNRGVGNSAAPCHWMVNYNIANLAEKICDESDESDGDVRRGNDSHTCRKEEFSKVLISCSNPDSKQMSKILVQKTVQASPPALPPQADN